MLQTIDTAWKDHLLSMDHLKEGIGLRGYGQRDPLREYQREGYEMFVELIERIKEQTVANLMRLQLAREADLEALTAPQERPVIFSHGGDEGPAPRKRESKKIGRNDPCTCGSGKKYKKCCGRCLDALCVRPAGTIEVGMKPETYRVPGFLAHGIHTGIKANGCLDLALIFSTRPAKAAGVFTTNCFKDGTQVSHRHGEDPDGICTGHYRQQRCREHRDDKFSQMHCPFHGLLPENSELPMTWSLSPPRVSSVTGFPYPRSRPA